MTDETLLGIASIVGAVVVVQSLFFYGIVKLVVTGRPILKWHADQDDETAASPLRIHRP